MQKGDISNEAAPRVILVLDELLFRLPPKKERQEKLWVRAGQWDRAARLLRLDDDVRTHLWDLVWRSKLSVDVATFKPEPYAEAIRIRMDWLNIPYGHYLVTTPNDLAKQMAFMPNVAAVYYAVPERDFVFGDRGVRIRRPQDIHL